jgi:hypothetical protein
VKKRGSQKTEYTCMMHTDPVRSQHGKCGDMRTLCAKTLNAYKTKTDVGKSEKVPIRGKGARRKGRETLQIMWTVRRFQTDHAGRRDNRSCNLRSCCDHPYRTYSQIFSSGYRGCGVSPSKVKRLENCETQDSTKSSPECPETRYACQVVAYDEKM